MKAMFMLATLAVVGCGATTSSVVPSPPPAELTSAAEGEPIAIGSRAPDFKLPFHLVSDPQGAIARAYGVDDKSGFFDNDTIVVGSDGYVKKISRSVDPAHAVPDVLTAL